MRCCSALAFLLFAGGSARRSRPCRPTSAAGSGIANVALSASARSARGHPGNGHAPADRADRAHRAPPRRARPGTGGHRSRLGSGGCETITAGSPSGPVECGYCEIDKTGFCIGVCENGTNAAIPVLTSEAIRFAPGFRDGLTLS